MPTPPWRRKTLPARSLDPAQLIEYTRFVADQVARGDYPYVRYDVSQRWHQRLYRDGRVDLWLISWLPSQGTQLHDHGSSSGAFTVVTGELSEAVLTRASPTATREARRSAGDSTGFGAEYVHDVRNLAAGPAVSVHAYSPPLQRMTFYDLDAGRLSPLVTLSTDDPEAAPGERNEAAA